MGRLSILDKKNLAVIRIGLVAIFFITCVVVPAMKLLPFFEWTIIQVHHTFVEFDQTTTRVYFDGITRYKTYSAERFPDTIHEYSFNELKNDLWKYDLYPKLSREYLEILSPSGMGLILLGTIIFGLKLGMYYYLWQFEKQIKPLIYHGSSIVTVLGISIHWTLLIIAFVGANPIPVYGATRSFLLPPTPNLILVILMVLGIVSLMVSDHIESILSRLERVLSSDRKS
ncbi:MAG: hypothetical protein ACFFB5_23365 [Promethearchaeota archaeon]